MTKKAYIRPLTEVIEARYDGSLMKWNSTQFSDDPIDDDDFNAKQQGFFDNEEDSWPQTKSLWDD